MSEVSSAARFPTTCWSRILAAGDPDAPEARAALEGLCRDYWYPLYAFVRRKGHDPETAQDLVQGLFAGLLERDDLMRPGAGAGTVSLLPDGLLLSLPGQIPRPGAGPQARRRPGVDPDRHSDRRNRVSAASRATT